MENTNTTTLQSEDSISQENILETKYADSQFPSLLKRVQAVFIDVVMMLIVFVVLTLITDKFGDIHQYAKAEY